MWRLVWLVGGLLAVAACRFDFDATSDAGTTTRGDGSAASIFTPLTLPPGGSGGPLVRGTDGTIYSVQSATRVFASHDGGTTWTECGQPTGQVPMLAVDPASGTLYAGGYREVFASTDRCATWTALGFARPNYALAILAGTVIVGAADGTWQWNGSAWSRYSTPFDGTQVADIEVSTGTPPHIFVSSPTLGIARSLDGGATWSTANSGLVGLDVYYVALDPTNASHVMTVASSPTASYAYESSDDGSTWTALNDDGDSITFDPASPSFALIASWQTGLGESTDGAASFDLLDHRSQAMFGAGVGGVLFGSSSSVLISTLRGLFAAPDHNLAWTEVDTGIGAWTVNTITIADDATIYLGTTAGLLVSHDGGATWSETAAPATTANLSSMVQAPGDPSKIVTAGTTTVGLSSDHGATLTPLTTGLLQDAWHFNVARITPAGLVIGAWADAVTSDSTWTTFTHHPVAGAQAPIRDLLVLDTAGMEILASTADGLYYSADGGSTWNAASSGLASLETWSAIQLADGTLLVATDAGAYRSSSPTGPWVASGLAAAPVSVFVASAGHIVAACDNGAFDSTDNGLTWRPLPGLERQFPIALALDPGRGRLLVGTGGFGLYTTAFPPP